MAHIRKQVRDAAKARLTGGTVATAQIYAGRVRPVDSDKFPAWQLLTPGEVAAPTEIGSPREITRTIRLVAIGFAKGGNILDRLDALAVEAESRLCADLKLGGIVRDVRLVATDTDLQGEARDPLGTISLNFEVEGYTLDTDPETPL